MTIHLLALALCCLILAPGVRAAEAVHIGGVGYDTVDPGQPFREAARPAQDWQAPAPGRSEQEAGMIAYATPDPGDFRPWSVPRPKERVDSLS
ncbi:MAG: hypothetical protein IT210_20130, partial [Armatimonadetes bacterium]|nr:hypothetical protein [Armatimonadota bacterium]